MSGPESSHIEVPGIVDRMPASDRCSEHPIPVASIGSRGTLSQSGDEDFDGFWLVIVNHSPAKWRARISETKQLIGRSPDADIQVADQFRSVSRRHAEIWCDKRGVSLSDLGSTAGTRINDAFIPTKTPVRLRAGDRITLGQLLLILGDGVTPILSVVEDLLGNHDPATVGRIDEYSLLVRSQPERLTPAENEILLWISRGVLNDEAIGNLTHRSPNTVRTHVANLLRKLSLHSRAEVWGFLQRPA